MNMKKVLFLVTVVLLLAAFGVSAFMVGSYLLEGKAEEKRNEELAQLVEDGRNNATEAAPVPEQTTPVDGATEPAATEPKEKHILEVYEPHYAQNSDMVGWLEIPQTKVKYPVMQTPEDPNYYLKHNFDKRESARGAIYAWGSADINKPSDNITLFGHNMADGSMFATLGNYNNEYFWKSHSLIFFDTLYEYHQYKVFAVFKTSATLGGDGFSYHQFVDAENEEEFNEFIATCKKLSFYDTGITPVYGDKILCLSTCEYTLENGRFVVCAYRIT